MKFLFTSILANSRSAIFHKSSNDAVDNVPLVHLNFNLHERTFPELSPIKGALGGQIDLIMVDITKVIQETFPVRHVSFEVVILHLRLHEDGLCESSCRIDVDQEFLAHHPHSLPSIEGSESSVDPTPILIDNLLCKLS